MSKIVCDVCGTSYPETSTQCPICGCARSGDAKPVVTDNTESEPQVGSTYTYVKGGRFSKANVKKRNKGIQTEEVTPDITANDEPKKKSKLDSALIATVVILLLAIVAVLSYIVMRIFFPGILSGGSEITLPHQTEGLSASTSDYTSDATTLSAECTAITLSKTEIEFDKVGAVVLLNATTEPANTDDIIQFTSTDTNVVTVTADGKIEAVGPGQAAITVTCGQVVAECRVICDFAPAETTGVASEPTYATDDFKLNRSDFTLSKKGESHVLYKGKIPVESITWSSDNDKVATIKNGKVVAVGSGQTVVYAEYQGIKLSCIVRCAPSVGAASNG